MAEKAQKLTAKQERFCLAYIETGSGAEAYRSAYHAEGMKPATIHRRAFDLLENGKIGARLAELRQPAIERAELTLEGHLAELAALRDQAKGKGMLSAAVAAEVSRGKAAGIYRQTDGAPGTVIVNAINCGSKPAEDLTDDELIRICLARGLHILPSLEYEREIKALFREM